MSKKQFTQSVIPVLKNAGRGYYVNIARFRNGAWGIIWDDEYAGANSFFLAVEKRKKFYAKIQKFGYWSSDKFKTIKII